MADAFELSFAGYPFREPSEVVRSVIERRMLVENTLPPLPPEEWAPYLPPTPPIPPVRVGELFYPWGARRWARFVGLMHKDDLDAVLPLVADSDSAGKRPKAGVFKMHVGDPTRQVQTDLYMLPPQPLTGLDDAANLWLVTLVDERYYWRFAPVSVRSANVNARYVWQQTWASLFTALGGAVGKTISLPGGVASNYGQPDASSPFYAHSQPVPAILDAACAHVGRVLVRAFDGTYTAQRYADATAAAETARGTRSRKTGGLSFTTAQAHEAVAGNSTFGPAANRPVSVTVVEGVWDTKAGTHGAEDRNIPADDRTDFLESVTIQTSPTFKGFVQGNAFTATVRERGTSPPANIATELTADWYEWNARNLSETYDGVESFDPLAGLDAAYDYFGTSFRVWFDGFNYEFREFWHWDGVVTNEWPRTAMVQVLSVESDCTANAGITMPTDPGLNGVTDEGGEWPAIKLVTGANKYPAAGLCPFFYGQVLEATYYYTQGGTTYYWANGIQQASPGVGGFGNVWSGDQYFGYGTKYMGAASFGNWGASPVGNGWAPNWIYHGITTWPGGLTGPSNTSNFGGFIFSGGRSANGFANTMGGNFPLQTIAASAITLGESVEVSQAGGSFGPGVWPGGAFHIGSFGGRGFMFGVSFGSSATVVGPTPWEVLEGGGTEYPEPMTGSGIGAGVLYGNAFASAGFFAIDPGPFAPASPRNITGLSARVPFNAGGHSTSGWGTYPPNPNGPMVFANGLYVGGGQQLVSFGSWGNLTLNNRLRIRVQDSPVRYVTFELSSH